MLTSGSIRMIPSSPWLGCCKAFAGGRTSPSGSRLTMPVEKDLGKNYGTAVHRYSPANQMGGKLMPRHRSPSLLRIHHPSR